MAVSGLVAFLLVELAELLAQRTDPKPSGPGSSSEEAVVSLESRELRSLIPKAQSQKSKEPLSSMGLVPTV